MPTIRYEDHTDSVPDKLDFLQRAYRSGDRRLALSLASSIQDTIRFEHENRREMEPPQVEANAVVPVTDLPTAWADWARGWTYCKPLALFETVGIARSREPVDLSMAFPAEHTWDLQREVRVAWLDPSNGGLHEVPSQLYGEVRNGAERQCRLVFQADVPMHGQASYLVFYGNPQAERPDYATDLCVTGEGYGLEVTNEHYVARLSRQMGQLERLTYRHEHGLELYAGGKGHGEPPTIDWAHDYVDQDGFQKLRMRNWSDCANYEVIRGPLLVRVRRWGFPASPIHPVFTPSRIHMDVTYTFHAGLPYFFKESRFDVVKDVRIEAMRDDEWVLSGYSFTDTLWIDRAGQMHEGKVPTEQAEDLWGVGFFHRDSRDAFIALWLEHTTTGAIDLTHGGVPRLHYGGHGQLWSRYPAQRTTLAASTSIRQRNAYLTTPYPTQDAATAIQRVRHQLTNPLELGPNSPVPRPAGIATSGSLARVGETKDSAALKDEIWRVLREVKDEQLYTADANIVDMGYVYDVRVRQRVVHILVTMPHRGRPVYQYLVTRGGGRVQDGIAERVRRLPGVRDVVVHFTWDPPWSVARMTDAGRRALGLPA